ncbi:E3 ubiquitin-protein ligase TRIM39 [Silurus asotus]|uniref:E3 ubiquitin-protein ligase TRIM39 n=1 Tax=Silurus asotus TaxID=30991 RepID=A0AAD5FSA5_SILAS|nr:E3 ubiquitin-protein ligase TRIM39 [Silurus asotus]
MASSSSALCEDQLQCSICLDVFTDPVSTPCGHNFCMICLKEFWDSSSHCQCPVCKEEFYSRPYLRVNTFISALAAPFKKSVQVKSSRSADQLPFKSKKVLCDSCIDDKLEALKSCLHCGVSFCNTHLMPHKTTAKLMKHKLMEPVENLEDYICQKHERSLELFCRDDQMCVCQFCTEGDHKTHNTVSIEEESVEKKNDLVKTQAEVQQKFQDRLKKIEEIKHSVKVNKINTEKEKADVVEMFSALMRCIERSQAELLKVMEEKQKAAERQAEEIIKNLEQELSELKRKNTDLEQVLHTEDHLHLLQIYPSLCSSPHTQDWTSITFTSHLSVETLRRALAQLQETLSQELEKIDETVDVTLDPDTANPYLVLSDDGKQVYDGDTRQNLPDNPERFDTCACMLGKKGFSSGRFYYEVQVKGKTEWDLGVARESINRKGEIKSRPEDGYWCVILRNKTEYLACDSPSVFLSLKQSPQKVGVLVDYEEGLVSFYNVDAKSHIYSFTAQTFTEKLYPLFSPSLNYGGGGYTQPLWGLFGSRAHYIASIVLTCPCNSASLPPRRGGSCKYEELPEVVTCAVQKLDIAWSADENKAPLFTMASTSSALCKDQLLCCICLDVFTDPVSTPCGHNFCMICLKEYWDRSSHCQCPVCKEKFSNRPRLRVNTFISALAAPFKRSVQLKSSRAAEKPTRSQLLCEICCEKQCVAVKSCLICMASYCKTHLEPHDRVSSLKKHKLMEPVENLEDYICQKHDRPLELFCRDDQTCVCQFCIEGNHKPHNTVSIEEESIEKKNELVKTQAEVQQKIQERLMKIEEIKHSVEVNKINTDTEKADVAEMFSALMCCIERSQAELLKVMEEKQKAAEKQAEEFIKDLEQELSDLKRKNTDLEQLLHTEDHLHLLQIYPSLCSSPHTQDWTSITITSHLSVETLRRALAQLQETLSQEMEKIPDIMDVTLDPDTAHPDLVLSDDGKHVTCGDKRQPLSDNPERFNNYCIVLGKEGFSSGRFYYEVQVKVMASSSSALCEDQLECSICLDVFTDPVSTPCGHNFCMICLKEFWDSSSHCQCPVCKEKFSNRPDLRVNTFISALAATFKKSVQLKSSKTADQLPSKSRKVLCDSCTENKLKALKSCLHCGLSFCNSHLMPHKTTAKLMKHKLMEPVENLEDYICQKHERPLELFCRDDQTCVCQFCSERDHKTHKTVPIEEESVEKKNELVKTQTEVQQKIQERLKKIEEIKHSVEVNKINTEKEKADVVKMFSALICCIERSQAELLQVMEEKQTAAKRQAEKLIKDLEQELSELKRRNTDLEQLLHTDDHLHLLQIYPSLCSSPHTQDWPSITITSHLGVETLRRALAQLQGTFRQEMKKIDETVDVTLDPDTANPYLIQSDDGKQVYDGDTRQNLPDNPERFDTCACMLGKKGFSSGRFYYEVQVKGKSQWDLGVARESINRKGEIIVRPEDGYWCMVLRNKTEYKALESPRVSLPLNQAPQKVGVFVDYEEGLVSFYDVDAKCHIYSFTAQTFTEKLYPYFCPCFNDGEREHSGAFPKHFDAAQVPEREHMMHIFYQNELVKTQAEVQQKIEERLKMIMEIKHSVEVNKINTEKGKADVVEKFSALIHCIKQSQAELLKVMEEKQKAAEKQAEEFIKDIEQELSDLKRRNTDLEQLLHTEDHLHLLQIYPSLCGSPHTQDWTSITITSDLSVETLRRALAQLQETLSQEMEKIPDIMDVTLDPDTAHPDLVLSDDGKQVTFGEKRQNLPYIPERFNFCVCVMGEEGFSSGRFYYEVQVKGKTELDFTNQES